MRSIAAFVLVFLLAVGYAGTGETLVPSVSAASMSGSAFRYEIDKSQSTFMVKASRGGLAWFKGHDHLLAVRDFSGHATLDLMAVKPASLVMTIAADSLVETAPNFSQQQKDIIKRQLDSVVLESKKYPTITFASSDVKARLTKDGRFDVKITGEITLHGVTKRIVIPATVTANGDTLSARGVFTLKRSDFNVKTTSAFHGMVRVRDKLKFTFDINARRVLSF